MTAEEMAKFRAGELVESWMFGTDLADRLPEWVIQDLREKAAVVILEALQNDLYT
jgi:hypothetical protein